MSGGAVEIPVPQPNGYGVDRLVLADARDPATWMLRGTHKLGERKGKDMWEVPLMESLGRLTLVAEEAAGVKWAETGPLVMLAIGSDNLGRHSYVSLADVKKRVDSGEVGGGVPLKEVSEQAVKNMRLEDSTVQVWRASTLLGGGGAARSEEGAVAQDFSRLGMRPRRSSASAEELEQLCPQPNLFRNYGICHDLTLGPTKRVVLCDEDTLRRGVRAHQIGLFHHLRLIVNCHEDDTADEPGKYSVGDAQLTCRKIFIPIHTLYGGQETTNAKIIHDIQEKIWASLQDGSVAVHCLAGLHRAPMVVCCQYLYRWHALGHRDGLANNLEEIYERLARDRPGAEPLGYARLIKQYNSFLLKEYAS